MMTGGSNQLGRVAVILLLVLLVSSQAFSARLFKSFRPEDQATAEPGPKPHVHASSSKNKCPPFFPSEENSAIELEFTQHPGKLARKHGPLLFTMLPKKPVPPSGPSKRSNNLNN
uniref:Uncharacterized protein n=1 Tax=Nelumbo nucifera TaxID=4432 RepID=A0A822Z7N6_NELNU|nr:TPA_asm: hypothetical protein HUJ06_015415 [Nelumbo nucifera]